LAPEMIRRSYICHGNPQIIPVRGLGLTHLLGVS
jgi:hypothetical protein